MGYAVDLAELLREKVVRALSVWSYRSVHITEWRFRPRMKSVGAIPRTREHRLA